MIPVRVRYSLSSMSGEQGWSFIVLAARGELRRLGEGWSKGKKREAVSSFRAMAAENGWVETEMRADGMRGVA